MTGAAEWSGQVGSAWSQEWLRTDRSFADLSRHLDAAILDALPSGPARVVDIGSGAGTTSIALARTRPDVSVTGIDISPDLVAVARERGMGLENLAFVAGPVEQVVAALAPVDLFVSRHGVMFFADPLAAFGSLRAAAAPAGRIVFTCFCAVADNPWAGTLAAAASGGMPAAPAGYAPGPFAFADPAFVTDLLARAGWNDARPVRIDYRYRAGEGADPVGDALSFFKRIGPTAGMLNTAEGAERDAMLARLRTALEAVRQGDVVDFPAAAWLWSAQAS